MLELVNFILLGSARVCQPRNTNQNYKTDTNNVEA